MDTPRPSQSQARPFWTTSTHKAVLSVFAFGFGVAMMPSASKFPVRFLAVTAFGKFWLVVCMPSTGGFLILVSEIMP